MSLTQQQVDAIVAAYDDAISQDAPELYWTELANYYSYAELALRVWRDEGLDGITANNYAANKLEHDFNDDYESHRLDISMALMTADFNARKVVDSNQNIIDFVELSGADISAYHNTVFSDMYPSLPAAPHAWTAYDIVQVLGSDAWLTDNIYGDSGLYFEMVWAARPWAVGSNYGYAFEWAQDMRSGLVIDGRDWSVHWGDRVALESLGEYYLTLAATLIPDIVIPTITVGSAFGNAFYSMGAEDLFTDIIGREGDDSVDVIGSFAVNQDGVTAIDIAAASAAYSDGSAWLTTIEQGLKLSLLGGIGQANWDQLPSPNDDSMVALFEHIDGHQFETVALLNSGSSFTAGASSTLILGRTDADTLIGGSANDFVYGDGGDDKLVGGAGNDILVGGEGHDTADYSGSESSITIKYEDDEDASPLYVEDGTGGTDMLVSVEKIVGSTKNDVVKISSHLPKDLKLEIDLNGGEGVSTDLLDASSLQSIHLLRGESGKYKIIDNTTGGAIDVINFEKGTLIATSGDDTIEAAMLNTVFSGGGHDVMVLSPFVRYADLDNDDRIVFGTYELKGALRWAGTEDPYARDGIIEYGLEKGTGNLIIRLPFDVPVGNGHFQFEAVVDNYVGGPGVSNPTANIQLAELSISAHRLLDSDFPNNWLESTLEAFKTVYQIATGQPLHPGGDPLVLDLGADGLELFAQSSASPLFDMDGDGFAERSGWVGADDGFLVYDQNENDVVDGLSELFGSPTDSGFAALAELDSNADNVINASDSAWADLRVWQDINFNGISDAGELIDLATAGITSFNLTTSSPEETLNQGNAIVSVGTFTRNDNSTGDAYDVNFVLDNFNSHYLGDTTVSETAAALPNLQGHGILTDLQIAMSNDANLLSAVDTAMTAMAAPDMQTLRDGIEPVLWAWADTAMTSGVDIPYSYSVDGSGSLTVLDYGYYDDTAGYWKLASGNDVLDGNGNPIAEPTQADILAQSSGSWGQLDAQAVAFMESYYGDLLPFDNLIGQSGSGPGSIKAFIELYDQVRDYLAVTFAVQGPLASYFPNIELDTSDVTSVFTSSTNLGLVPVFEQIFLAAPSDPGEATQYFADWDPILDIFIGQYSRGSSVLQSTYSFVFANIVAAYENVGAPISLSDIADAFQIPNILEAVAGTTNGTTENDIFYMGAGGETAAGGSDHDAYVIGLDFGDDVITDHEVAPARSIDLVRFAQYTSDEFSAERVGTDLVLTLDATGDTLTITGQFTNQRPALIGGYIDDDYGVDEIIFADGVVWTPYEMAKAVSHPESTSDTINGTDAVDYLDGGAGNDLLLGGMDGDAYVFGTGYGNDTIQDEMDFILLDAPDVVYLADLTPEDVTFVRNGSSNDLEILVNGSSDTLTIIDQFNADDAGPFGIQWLDRIEMFAFSDGSLLGWEDVLKALVTGTDQDDTIFGFFYQDDIAGGPGDDYLSGGNEGDTYHFNAGDGQDTIEDLQTDILYGAADTLVFGPDIVPGDVILSRDGDSLDLHVIFAESSDAITIVNQFQDFQTGPYGEAWFNRIENFVFDDGTAWTWSGIIERLDEEAGTSGNDTIYGFSYNDTIQGREGNDHLLGGNGSDTYIFNLGDGADTLEDNLDNVLFDDVDKVVFGAGIDETDITAHRQGSSDTLVLDIGAGGDQIVLVNQYGRPFIGSNVDYIEEFHFADATVLDGDHWRQATVDTAETSGNDTIYGYDWQETLAGGPGNDSLEGRSDGDTYLFNLGDGVDTIKDNPTHLVDAADAVVFGAGIAPSDVAAHRQGSTDTIILDIGTGGDQIVLVDQYNRPSIGWRFNYIEEFHFADTTVLDGDYWRQAIVAAAETSGNDTVIGFNWQDTLAGGLGNDCLQGSGDGDTYLFDIGDGQDVILDNPGTVSGSTPDEIVFGTGITDDDIVAVRDGANDDLVLQIDGTTDQIRIANQFTRSGSTHPNAIEEVHFSGGVLREEPYWRQLVVDNQETSGDDTIYGSNWQETLAGGEGDDRLEGRGGSDTYLFNLGDGQDVIYDWMTNASWDNEDQIVLGGGISPSDVLATRSGDDLILSFASGPTDLLTIEDYFLGTQGNYEIEEIQFANGTVWTHDDILGESSSDLVVTHPGTTGNDSLTGTSGDDVFEGGLGNDTLAGHYGNDVYLYNAGDGNDTIFEGSSEGTADRLMLGSGLTPVDTVLSRSGVFDLDDMTLTFAGGGSIFLDNQFFETPNYGVEKIIFDNGPVWTKQNLAKAYLAQVSTSGNDSINGFSGFNDTITGGVGNDTMNGFNGNDTYVYHLGDGADTINEIYGHGTLDRLTFGSGIAMSDISLTRSLTDLDDVTLTLSGGGSIFLDEEFYEVPGAGLERIDFSNGTYWDKAALEQKLIDQSQTSSDDLIYGFDAENDTLEGGHGNDTFDGLKGNDTFIYGLGDGADTINEGFGRGTADRLILGDGILTSEVLLTRSLTDLDDVTLHFSGGGSIFLNEEFYVVDGSGVEQIVFADATIWDKADLKQQLIDQSETSGNDLIYGFDADSDTLEGRLGNDTLDGLDGDDTFIYNLGDGADIINESFGSGTADRLVLGTGILPSSVTVVRSLTDLDDVTLQFSDGGSVFLNEQFYPVPGSGIEQIEFADHTIWTETDLLSLAWFEGTSSADTITGTSSADNIDGLDGNDSLNGSGGNDRILGESGNDTIDGGTGTDTMAGGLGNDSYFVDASSDVVTEASGEGTDVVQSSISYTLSANVEALTLTGSSGINGTGNALDNAISGNSGTNSLTGGDGNDTLDGAAGADSMAGGLGNDIFVVDTSSDVVTEASGEGTDAAQSSVSYTLPANVENLTLTGSFGNSGTGNSLDNAITGNSGANSLTGGSGNDTFDGGAGADSMAGGLGNDIYVVDSSSDVVTEVSGEGTDTIQSSVTYTLAVNVENLTLTGTSVINGTANSLDNALIGNSGANTLDGGAGADTMAGGLGDDTYVVDTSSDVVSENVGEGTDTVQSSIAYTLGANIENLTLTGSSGLSGTGNALDNAISGNSGANSLTGGDGNDTLDGASGTDSMTGGLGNDTYVVDTGSDVVTESAGEGVDTVQSAIAYTLGANVENLLLTGSSGISGTGNSLDNAITGNSGANSLTGGDGNDTLDGAAGVDSMAGGLGNDIYVVDTGSDVVIENANEGTDAVQSSVTYVLGSNLENLTLTGSSGIGGTGNSLDNSITGNSGANTLDGGAGADTMAGGLGNDTYVVDNSSDVVTENTGEGADTVQSSVTYALSVNVENLTLSGTSGISGTGNALDNALTGNSGANSLTGEDGNDTLDGATGADSMAGGLGNDTYVVDNSSDAVTEASGEGTDMVQSSVTYTLGANIENLTLTGSSTINGTGNALDNALTGNSGANSLTGGDGNDTINGGAGVDSMAGGLGNDLYVVDSSSDVVNETASEGADTVQSSVNYTLGSNIENLTLTGTSFINGSGNSLDNVLTGNSGANSLNGGTGADTMVGGLGNDIYVVDSTGDVVTENAGEGTDGVQSSITYTLGANVENLTLTGGSAINGTGNSLNNTINGNTGANALTGMDGNDWLDGGFGGSDADSLVGGAGNDTYIVRDANDVVTENAGEGIDEVQSLFTYTLGANLETLRLTGSSAANGTGNALDNTIVGNFQVNALTGADGNDSLDGGSGADTLTGGLGDDIYVVDNSGDVVNENAGEGTDTVLSSVTFALSATLEHLTLTGGSAINGTGNALDNSIAGNGAANSLTGGNGNDTLNGGFAADTMVGGLGNDVFVVDNAGDIVTENSGEGADTIQSAVSYTLGSNFENLTLTGVAYLNGTGNGLDNVIIGTTLNNSLSGGDGNDTIDGNLGSDSMAGGLGNDLFIVDSSGDVVNENASEGTDAVQSSVTYTLSANVENLTLTGSSGINGTGNALDNSITGNSGANTLDGGSGADTMAGGLGNDTYVIDNSNDVVTENAGEGTDTIQTSITYTLSENVENLTLTGSSGIGGTGNALDNSLAGNSGVNSLTGGDGNDTVNGGVGTDTMAGGLGNDLFVVDNSGDVVAENAGEGTDSVQSAIAYTLSANVENLMLTGSSWVNGTGNELDNAITGNVGGNSLSGGDGNDTLDGGAAGDSLAGGLGNDLFIVDSSNDVVTENSSEGTDTIQSSVTYTLSANVENLTLTGSSGINGTGNALDNAITGNSGANSLDGGSGNDTINGKNGADALTGSAGADMFVFDAGSGDDVISDFEDDSDTIDFRPLSIAFEDLTISQVASDTVILWNGGDVTLLSVTSTLIDQSDFLFA